MKISTDHFYCVILAGGKGRRLWPCSREQHPKQFIDARPYFCEHESALRAIGA